MTLVCVPIFVEDIDAALRDAAGARDGGADLVEWRLDTFFHGSTGSDAEDAVVVRELQRLLAESPLPAILTCRPAWEGGEYDGDDADRVALFEKLCNPDRPEHAPAYLDVELAAYTRSANLRQKIDLCVAHPRQQRDVKTRLILSTHDFEGRPADLDRRLLAAYDAPACSIVKVAYRARSLRDNLDLFELTRGAPKPTIALGMGEFGLMSRVLAPKFGGYLTFASLRDTTVTAPGQPTLDDLLNLYRFRSIGRDTRVYGVIGWPVGHSLSPHVHSAGFKAVGHDGVYLPLPIAADPNDAEASYLSFRETHQSLLNADLLFAGASVTIPHKANLLRQYDGHWDRTGVATAVGVANTLCVEWEQIHGLWDIDGYGIFNTDTQAIQELADEALGTLRARKISIVGAGGAARAAAYACLQRGAQVSVFNRSLERAVALADSFESLVDEGWEASIRANPYEQLAGSSCDLYINCTPVGMTGGPDPDGLSIPVPDMPNVTPDTVFFDTVYNPIETPMLRAARERGCQTIDGVEMFVRQAAAQFELWTSKPAPTQLFDRICREKLAPRP